MQHCFLWVDFCCINQDHDPAGELKALDSIVQACDCILTPIVDPDHAAWQLKDVWRGMLLAYEAAAWRGGPHSYVNRAWCRIEMFFAAHVPLRSDISARALKFQAGLKYAATCGRRPHLLFGTREAVGARSLKILEPLQHKALEEFNPAKGELTVESDRIKIQELMLQLRPYIKDVRLGYVGQRNAVGQHHGLGSFLSEQGHSYKGEWASGKQHGSGCYYWTNGSCYSGEFRQNKRHGHGRIDGDEFLGRFAGNARWGPGLFKSMNHDGSSDVYYGMYLGDKRHGRGQMQYELPHNGGPAVRVETGYWEDDIFVGDRRVDWSPPPTPAVASNADRIIPCRNWTASGSCPFGDKCHFKDSHTSSQ